ncbi:MAG: hypothetical protein PF486_10105 [Prolixibacteraceae bacterium]|jgi:hypothetical protein|nr:hypothetical protein [Prolixibacteraceae bacterium]
MNKLKLLVFLTLLSTTPLLGLAQDRFYMSGKLHYSNFSYFSDKQDNINGRNEGLLQVELSSKRESPVQWSAVSELREDLSDASRKRLWIDELWARKRFGSLDVTMGKQIISWGTTDGINPVNNINPIDYSDLLETDDETIGVYALRLQWFFNMADIDAIYTPVASFGVLPDIDSRWFPSAKMMGLHAPLDDIDLLNIKKNEPNKTLANGEFGLRIRKRLPGTDLAFSYFNGYDHLPGYIPDMNRDNSPEQGMVLIENYRRQQVIGAELVFMLPWGWAFRGESALFIPEDDDVNAEKYVQTVAGVDKNIVLSSSSLRVIMQYIYDYNIDGGDYEDFDLRHLFTNSPMGNIDWTFHNGLSLSAMGIYNFDADGYFINPGVSYTATGGLCFSVQADILGGADESFFGNYSFNNRVRIKMSYRF